VRLAAYPNPFRGSATITWGVQLAGNVSLKLYDAAGREVRNLVGRGMDPGRYTATWDGRSNDGKRVAEGIYFCKLSTATGMQQQKVIVAR
jgi:serine protease AprX